ncbi:MAG: DUF2490 domain-containing protein [Prolixibacteraceae bacterium]|nr:DUF2490 domain-containing protein [Prolixibacteraceae bacterium]
MKHIIPALILVFFTGKITAQDTFLLGTLPSLNFNKGLNKDWSLNLKAESRISFLQGEFGTNPPSDFEFQVADFAFTTARKTGLNNSLAGGYLIRLKGSQTYHRLIQQFTLVRRYESFRLAHRISSDQTFNSEEPWELRLRYRITFEIPLNGQSVDPGEFYLKLNNEYLNSWEEKEADLEIRLSPLTGYGFKDSNKLEFGLDYRLSSFLDGYSRNSFWFNIAWLIKV